MQDQQLQVVGTQVILQGERADFTVQKHGEKLKVNPLDCGCDIFAHKIRVATDAAPSPEDPCYDILGLTDHKNLIYIHTGLIWITGPNTYSLLTERSSSIEKLNGGRVVQGIIDANYTGELIVRVEASTTELDEVIAGIEHCIEAELAVAQMIVMGFFYPGFIKKSESGIIVPLNGRGANGFGSTDKLR